MSSSASVTLVVREASIYPASPSAVGGVINGCLLGREMIVRFKLIAGSHAWGETQAEEGFQLVHLVSRKRDGVLDGA